MDIIQCHREMMDLFIDVDVTMVVSTSYSWEYLWARGGGKYWTLLRKRKRFIGIISPGIYKDLVDTCIVLLQYIQTRDFYYSTETVGKEDFKILQDFISNSWTLTCANVIVYIEYIQNLDFQHGNYIHVHKLKIYHVGK